MSRAIFRIILFVFTLASKYIIPNFVYSRLSSPLFSVVHSTLAKCPRCPVKRSPGRYDNSRCTRIAVTGSKLFDFLLSSKEYEEMCCVCILEDGGTCEICSGCMIRRRELPSEKEEETGDDSRDGLFGKLMDAVGSKSVKFLAEVAEKAARTERQRRIQRGENGIGLSLLTLTEAAAKATLSYHDRTPQLAPTKCQDCFNNFNPAEGIACPGRAQHFVCKRCFAIVVHDQLSADARQRFCDNGARIMCELCLPAAVAYADDALAAALNAADFDLYRAAQAAARSRPPPPAPAEKAPAAQSECQVCFTDSEPTEGIVCPGPGRHFLCRGCFGMELREQISPAARGRFSAAGAQAVCRLCLPAEVAHADGALARALSDADFAAYRQAVIDASTARVYQQEEARLQKAMAALRAELAAGGGGAGAGGGEGGGGRAAERVRRHRLHLAEHVLCLHCPRCGQAFADFDGCFALTCGRCRCGFCAYCLADCGDDAHAHLAACPHNTAPGRGAFGDAAEFRRAHNARRARAVREYLRERVSPGDRAAVRAAIAQDLADLGMDSA